MTKPLVDIAEHGFRPGYFGDPTEPKLIIGSQGTGLPGDPLEGDPAEAMWDLRHGVEGLGVPGSLLVTLLPQPQAERDYQQEVFGVEPPKNINPPTGWQPGERLDVVVNRDPEFIKCLGGLLLPRTSLQVFHQTPESQRIADVLGVSLDGNPEFAKNVGTKTGMEMWAQAIGLPTPPTFLLSNASELPVIADALQQLGSKKLVIKLDPATGGMGHAVHKVGKAISHEQPHTLMPEGFTPDPEGHPTAVVQAWLPGRLGSVATWLDRDGTIHFTGAQMQIPKDDPNTGAQGVVGAAPMDEESFQSLLPILPILGKGYRAANAFGPHAMDVIFPDPEAAEQMGLPRDPHAHDENTRPGAWTIAQAYIHHLLGGGEKHGVGWLVSEVKVPVGTKAAHIIDNLRNAGLLLRKAGPDAHGAFPYGLGVVEHGGHNAFFVVTLSNNNDPQEAADILNRVNILFGNQHDD